MNANYEYSDRDDFVQLRFGTTVQFVNVVCEA
jgi:hypothetical protein